MTNPKEVIESLELSIKSEFVPWSQSRNFKNGTRVTERSLNWSVTLTYQERDILTTAYSAGIAHCKSYKMPITLDVLERLKFETEEGREARGNHHLHAGKPILPDTNDVIYSLLLDYECLDYSCFEDWANEFGYDIDSRKAERIYNDCFDIALKMRVIGEDNIAKLREAFQDY